MSTPTVTVSEKALENIERYCTKLEQQYKDLKKDYRALSKEKVNVERQLAQLLAQKNLRAQVDAARKS